MKKIFIIFSIFSLMILAQPTNTYAALDYSGLVQCDGVVDGGEPGRQTKCSFAALVNMANYIIRWLFALTVPIFIGIGAYAGFLFMTPNPGNRGKAKSMLWAALIGFVIMLSAYFIVATLLKFLVDKDFKGTDALIGEQK